MWCSQAFLPLLGTDLSLSGPPGKILNMSSIYASYTLPFAVTPRRTLMLLLSPLMYCAVLLNTPSVRKAAQSIVWE